jgi:hypothetical protein
MPTAPLPHPGLTGRQRAEHATDVQQMGRNSPGLLRWAAGRVVHRQLGRQHGHGVVAAWTAVAVDALRSQAGPVEHGYRQLATRHGTTGRALARARAKLLPPPGPSSTAAVLLRSRRGRLNVNTGEAHLSRWYPGDQLLTDVRGMMRAVLTRPPDSRPGGRGNRRAQPLADHRPRSAEHDTPSLDAPPPGGQEAGRALYAAWKAAQPPPSSR